MPGVLITGHSRGLGHGFAGEYLARGWTVFGLSRRTAELTGDLRQQCCDLSQLERIADCLDRLLGADEQIDLVILNAGVLGEIRDIAATSLDAIKTVMDINVWSNKVILDWLLARGIAPPQIVLISSGAAVNGNKGWGAYSLSKATLNMLAKLYAHEFSDSHLTALAPGLVDTAMQDYLCDPDTVDGTAFPSVRKLRAARGTAAMPDPQTAARHIAAVFPQLKARPSGSFVDIREL